MGVNLMICDWSYSVKKDVSAHVFTPDLKMQHVLDALYVQEVTVKEHMSVWKCWQCVHLQEALDVRMTTHNMYRMSQSKIACLFGYAGSVCTCKKLLM